MPRLVFGIELAERCAAVFGGAGWPWPPSATMQGFLAGSATHGRADIGRESICLDSCYMENWSLIGDVNIALETVGVTLLPDGAH